MALQTDYETGAVIGNDNASLLEATEWEFLNVQATRPFQEAMIATKRKKSAAVQKSRQVFIPQASQAAQKDIILLSSTSIIQGNQYVRKMKRDEAQQALMQLLPHGSEWQYNRFVRENGLDYSR